MLLLTVFAPMNIDIAGVSVMFLVLYNSSLSYHNESKLLIEELIFYLQ